MPRFTLTVLLLLLLPGLCFAQVDAEASRYGAAILQDGVPELLPGRPMNSDFLMPKFAVLENQPDSYALFFLQGERQGQMTYWSVLRRRDSTVTLTSLSFEQMDDGTLVDSTDLDIDLSTSARAPIEVRLLPSSSVVMFRWLGAASEQSASGGSPAEIPIAQLSEGSIAPDHEVRTLTGESVRLSEFAGNTVVINWWATSCAPCLAEMPGLNRLVEKYDGRDDLFFLAIAYDTESDLRAFLSDRSFLYRQAIGTDESLRIFGGGFPRNIIVDGDGVVVYDRLGANEDQYKDIELALEEHGLLGE